MSDLLATLVLIALVVVAVGVGAAIVQLGMIVSYVAHLYATRTRRVD